MKLFAIWVRNILIAIDQLGNAIAGGRPDITISARVGYFANQSSRRKFYIYWKFLEKVIDFTFYPLDGSKHCVQSLERSHEGFVHGSDLMRAILGVIAITACLFISVVTWSAYILGYRP